MSRIQEKADSILEEEELCDHCLGRQFAKLGHGLENYERGVIIRDTEGELEESDFDPENVPEDAEEGTECEVCDGVFTELEYWTDMVIDSFDRYELETFLIGIRPREEMLEAEEDLWEDYGIEWTEPIKTELSRLIGKRIEDEMDIEVDFTRADINAVVDMEKDRVELQVNSLLIYGQYNKYSREIPQTEWPCNKCRGSGCDECNWTGKQYQESVQELIQEPFIRETKGIEAKFHGGGREDIDVKCFGRREFVLEVIEPLNRDIDLEDLQEEVNESTDKVEVFDLRWAGKDEIAEIKQKHADKTYEAIVETGEAVEDSDLDELEKLETLIEQDTPTRVEHRRADKTREREVYRVETEKLDDQKFRMVIEAEAGTYIKELISSDEEKTRPSVHSVLGMDTECVQLDVIDVEK